MAAAAARVGSRAGGEPTRAAAAAGCAPGRAMVDAPGRRQACALAAAAVVVGATTRRTLQRVRPGGGPWRARTTAVGSYY
eukprot:SAG25_NODE_228_length_11469_cov_7.729903_3_plen_80_part_00